MPAGLPRLPVCVPLRWSSRRPAGRRLRWGRTRGPRATSSFTSSATAEELLPHFEQVARADGWRIELTGPSDGSDGRTPVPTQLSAQPSRSVGVFVALLSFHQTGADEYVWEAWTAPGIEPGAC